MKTIDFLLSHVTKDVGGNVDVSRIFSYHCYRMWLTKKETPPKYPEEAFRKVLIGHIQGLNGLQHFSPEIEKALLSFIRIPKVWPCFEQSKSAIGSKGFKKLGYWETLQMDILSPAKPFPFFAINDFYCSYEFQMPSPRERRFIANERTGRIMHSPRKDASVDVDSICEELYGGSIVGINSLRFHVYKSCYYLYQEHICTELASSGEVWTRTLEYKFDGTVFVCLNRIFLLEKYPNHVFAEIQDVSHQYKGFPSVKY